MFDEGACLRRVGKRGVLVVGDGNTNDEVKTSSFNQHEKCFCPGFAATSFVGADHRLVNSGSRRELGLGESSELAGISKHLGEVHEANIAYTLYFATPVRQILYVRVLAQ